MSTFFINEPSIDSLLENKLSSERSHDVSNWRNVTGTGERTFNTPDGRLSYTSTPAGQITANYRQTAALIILTATRDLHWRIEGGRNETFNAPAGTVLIIPASCTVHLDWPVQKEHLIVVLDDETVGHVCGASNHLTTVELFPEPSRYVDSKCLQVAHLLRAEMQKNAPIIESYLDALRTVFITLLLQNHSLLGRHFDKNETGGLSYNSARQIEAYLRDKFKEKVSIGDMAACLGVSPGHFLTSFRESFGQTPHQYLLMLRLNEVERCLRQTDISLAELAARIGFSSQSHMTTALKKNRNVTPGEIRRRRIAKFE